MENIAIQDPMFGKRAGATHLALTWLSKDFFAESGVIRATWQKEDMFNPGDLEYLDHQDVTVNMATYFTTGATKEERANAILNDLGIVKAETLEE